MIVLTERYLIGGQTRTGEQWFTRWGLACDQGPMISPQVTEAPAKGA